MLAQVLVTPSDGAPGQVCARVCGHRTRPRLSVLILSWALGKFIKTLLRKGFMMVTMLYCAQTPHPSIVRVEAWSYFITRSEALQRLSLPCPSAGHHVGYSVLSISHCLGAPAVTTASSQNLEHTVGSNACWMPGAHIRPIPHAPAPSPCTGPGLWSHPVPL